ncbi:NAD-dependent epimerase/dehydratase family protein [Candidatus Woesearchaeota archaeon]|nr:NAD-dependent epimerase/dehydratase family protein [Candidatus Woesearchaeota archaeon]
MKILITGGAGFIGSHVAEFYANKGHEVVVFDNLSRANLLKKSSKNAMYNWDYLESLKNITLLKESIIEFPAISKAADGADVIIHTAAQTAVTTSVQDPRPDFETNALGTFNVLEAARKKGVKAVLYCSTNKVYGDNVNKIKVIERAQRYVFEKRFERGIPERFEIDHNEHTPYGCSKLTGDLYMQDYAHLYGLKTGVFRMSCIYGTRQFGVEDQGWVAWFTIATVLGKPLTIFGDGKQVRDVLFVTDLINIYDRFINSRLKHGVFNTGGGSENTLSLLELLDLLKKFTGKQSKLSFDSWRPSDQKVYISDITSAQHALGWKPTITPERGVKMLTEWVMANKARF